MQQGGMFLAVHLQGNCRCKQNNNPRNSWTAQLRQANRRCAGGSASIVSCNFSGSEASSAASCAACGRDFALHNALPGKAFPYATAARGVLVNNGAALVRAVAAAAVMAILGRSSSIAPDGDFVRPLGIRLGSSFK
eukprot:4821024-Pleurochrysis_carterae.AAC.1